MSDAAADRPDRRIRLFLILYAIATAGSVVAYSPFLVLVLPARVTALTGAGDVRWLGQIILAGALAASVSGVVAGMLSDRTRRRRPWVLAGLVAMAAMLPVMGRIENIVTLLVVVTAWQAALNILLIPLAAWAADRVPPEKTGLLGGWLSLAPVVGAWSGLVLAGAGGRIEDRLWLIALIAVVAVAPILSMGEGIGAIAPVRTSVRPSAGAARRMWVARLLVQVGAGGPASYLFFWLRSIERGVAAAYVTVLFAVGLTLAAVLAMLLGRWIDRRGRPFPILATTALAAGAGLAAMAWAGTGASAHVAYIVFATTAAAFLALHSGQTLRVLPDPRRHGRDIGLFNLTNTAPSLIVPVLTILLVPRLGYEGLFLVSAGLCAGAAIVLFGLARADRRSADKIDLVAC